MPGINKVEYYGRTLLDLTGDTVTPETLAKGVTAHDASGAVITGIGKTTSVLYTEQALADDQKEQARTNIGAELAGKDTPITAHSEDGVTYTASVPWITELTVGARFTMLPDKLSTTLNPMLNVNGLGDIRLRCLTGYNNAATANGAFNGWISADRPIDVIYNGTYWITNMQRTSVSALYGTLKVEGGGTGATNADEALANLGVYIGETEPNAESVKAWIRRAAGYSGAVQLLPRVVSVSLPASGWTGAAAPYSQVVIVGGITAYTKVDLQPDSVQISSLLSAGIALMAENDAGTVTVYAFGGKPTEDYTIQATLTEVYSA